MNRHTCALYVGHFLRYWAQDPHAFDEDMDAWVENFLKPGNLQGGFNWYVAIHQARLDLIRNGPPNLPKIHIPTVIR